MIPKKIHYVWLGRGEKPELANKCIESWKKYLPDYEIIEWNEDNFDINSNTYLKEAYENKKYAFASDYIRLAVLYEYGGVYMDTDVEVIKNLDCFLDKKAFSGFENNNFIPTGIIAAQPKNKWIEKLLKDYESIHFVNSNGSFDLTTNTVRITNTTKKNYNINLVSSYQDLKDVVFYPFDYFCPKDWNTGKINITDNTYTIHHFSGSWHTDVEKKQIAKRKYYIDKFGDDIGIKKYEKYLKIQKLKRIMLLPFRAIANPKLVIKKIKGKINE